MYVEHWSQQKLWILVILSQDPGQTIGQLRHPVQSNAREKCLRIRRQGSYMPLQMLKYSAPHTGSIKDNGLGMILKVKVVTYFQAW